MADEWGPWIEHDGRPYPGGAKDVVQIKFRAPPRDFDVPRGNPDGDFAEVWAWYHDNGDDDIVRYRIRKPRGLTLLQAIAADPKPLVETDAPAPVATR